VISGSSISFSGSETAMNGTSCTGTLTGQGTLTNNTLTVQYSGSGSGATPCGNLSASVMLTRQ
jgi:hypothetical protein